MSGAAEQASGKNDVPYERVVGLVRHLTHDVRNGLNSLDLQAAFLQELTPVDGEAMPELKRLRSMISSTAKQLQAFSSSFWLPEPQFVTYTAQILVEDIRSRLGSVLGENAAAIEWTEQLGEEQVSVDLELMFRAVSDLCKNAIHFREPGRAISARAFVEAGKLIIELREEKSAVPSPPDTWGREPLVSTRRGGYGMSLYQARRILEMHRGGLDIAFDAAAQMLTTRVVLPLAAS